MYHHPILNLYGMIGMPFRPFQSEAMELYLVWDSESEVTKDGTLLETCMRVDDESSDDSAPRARKSKKKKRKHSSSSSSRQELFFARCECQSATEHKALVDVVPYRYCCYFDFN